MGKKSNEPDIQVIRSEIPESTLTSRSDNPNHVERYVAEENVERRKRQGYTTTGKKINEMVHMVISKEKYKKNREAQLKRTERRTGEFTDEFKHLVQNIGVPITEAIGIARKRKIPIRKTR